MANEKKLTWTKIKDFFKGKVFKFIKSKVFNTLIIIGLIAVIATQCSNIKELRRHQEVTDQNIIALNDSLLYQKTKNGALNVSIDGYIASEKELKELNKGLFDKIQTQNGHILSLNNTIVQLRQDSTFFKKHINDLDKKISELVKIDSNAYVAAWTLSYNYDSTNFDIFSGKTYIGVSNKDPFKLIHLDTEMTGRITQIDLTWGQKIEKGALRVFIESKYPGFTVAQMQGVLIDPNSNPYMRSLIKKKHWFSGFSLGIGATGGYNVSDNKFGLVIGPTISYNIYSF